MHGALLAATIANRGEMPPPTLIERAVDAQGARLDVARSARPPRARPRRRREVGRMMELTTRIGTARQLPQQAGQRYLPVEVAGKTGTLFYRGRPQDPALPSTAGMPEDGQLGYSWFVGFAPADQPSIAFAVLLGNPIAWQVRAHAVARHIIADYLATKAAPSTAASSRGADMGTLEGFPCLPAMVRAELSSAAPHALTWEPWEGPVRVPKPSRAMAPPHQVAAGLRIQARFLPLPRDTMLQPEVAPRTPCRCFSSGWRMRCESAPLAEARVTPSCTTTPICPGAGCFTV